MQDKHISRRQRASSIERQLRRLEKRVSELDNLGNQIATIRLAIALAVSTLILVMLFTRAPFLFALTLMSGLFSFVIAVMIHRNVKSHLAMHRIYQHIKQSHIARTTLNWDVIPAQNFLPQRLSPAEIDLDLPMLHRLLDTSVTPKGSARLRDWLNATHPEASRIARRQTLIRELIAMTGFRDKLAMTAYLTEQDMRRRPDGVSLVQWLESHTVDVNMHTFRLMMLLSPTTIGLFVLYSVNVLPPLWIFSFALYVVLYISQWKAVASLLSDALMLAGELRPVTAVMRFIEHFSYGKRSQLQDLVSPILENRPARVLRRVSWVAGAASLQQNPIFWPMVNALIPWDLYFALRLNKYRAELRESLPRWLDIWHELEALNALANFAYLNPHTTFPIISDQPNFQTQAIGHPLIADEQRVYNDFCFRRLGEIIIVTGSNMAGKSSFLRTLGVNLCLAYAGGTVVADHLTTGLFRLFTCIRVTDSLDDGISYFYAEVKRLKALLDALNHTDALPLFYLIDEIFRGTNNRERLVGSRAYITALAGKNGIGLIATHDLELTRLADDDNLIYNAHFREEVVNGQMAFDYRLREGPCPTTNALTIMALEGLPVGV